MPRYWYWPLPLWFWFPFTIIILFVTPPWLLFFPRPRFELASCQGIGLEAGEGNMANGSTALLNSVHRCWCCLQNPDLSKQSKTGIKQPIHEYINTYLYIYRPSSPAFNERNLLTKVCIFWDQSQDMSSNDFPLKTGLSRSIYPNPSFK